MQVISVPLGTSGVAISLSVSAGTAQIVLSVPAKVEVDALLGAVQAKLPASLQPIIAVLQAGIDAELSQA